MGQRFPDARAAAAPRQRLSAAHADWQMCAVGGQVELVGKLALTCVHARHLQKREAAVDRAADATQ